MPEYEFALKLNRELTPAETGALFEAGLSDAGIETGPNGTLVDVTREAPSYGEAVASAIRDVMKVPGLKVDGVDRVQP